MKPQTRAVLELLRERPQGITAFDALEDPRIRSFRLAARVYEIRREGYVVHSERVRTASSKVIDRYRLEEQTTLGLVS